MAFFSRSALTRTAMMYLTLSGGFITLTLLSGLVFADEFDSFLPPLLSSPSADSPMDTSEDIETDSLSPQGSYFMDKADQALPSQMPSYHVTDKPSQMLPDSFSSAEAPPNIPKLTSTGGQRIQATAQTEVHILKTPIVLNSNLKDKFTAYEFSIENHWHAPIELMQTHAAGSIDPEHGYLASLRRPHGMVGGMFGGDLTTNIIGGAISAATSGYTMMHHGSTHSQNSKTAQEANQFVKHLPHGTLQSGQRVTFKLLVPVGSTPELRVTFRDMDSHAVFAIAG